MGDDVGGRRDKAYLASSSESERTWRNGAGDEFDKADAAAAHVV
jgi:hypothetical protein